MSYNSNEDALLTALWEETRENLKRHIAITIAVDLSYRLHETDVDHADDNLADVASDDKFNRTLRSILSQPAWSVLRTGILASPDSAQVEISKGLQDGHGFSFSGRVIDLEELSEADRETFNLGSLSDSFRYVLAGGVCDLDVSTSNWYRSTDVANEEKENQGEKTEPEVSKEEKRRELVAEDPFFPFILRIQEDITTLYREYGVAYM
jgi:hypothetical protein